ncbi:MAG: PEP/pyruvate-binding domain-containing protein [Gammaproteobacteria bacterium]
MSTPSAGDEPHSASIAGCAGRAWRYIAWPGEVTVENAGAKAAALARMIGAGLPVPAFFVLRRDAFDASVAPPAREALAAAVPRGAVDSARAGLAPVPEVTDELRAAVAILGIPGDTFAVRSSALGEDAADHAFAGQLESRVFVPAAEVDAAVGRIWASGFGDRLRAYRHAHGIEGDPAAPAVIVQRAVHGDFSGVAFSADPVSGRRAIAVVSAVAGAGDALVSGAANADTWFVDRAGAIVDARAGPAARTLPPGAVGAIAALARRAEKFFGRPQDIEWTMHGSELTLLQSRPITTLAALPDPDAPESIWDSSNIAENYGGVVTTLTYSLARQVYDTAFRRFCTLAGVPAGVIAAHAATFRGLIGLVRGRMHYNLAHWHRLLGLLPGAATNRALFEQMIGARPSDAVASPAAMPPLARFIGCGTLAYRFARIGAHVRAYLRRQDRALQTPWPPPDQMRPDELVAHYRAVESASEALAGIPPLNDFLLMALHGTLRRLIGRWAPDRAFAVEATLLSGASPGVAGAIGAAIARMAELAATDAAFVDLLCEASRPVLDKALRDHPGFEREFRAYIARFGERCLDELELASPTLLDDPLPLLRSVGALARSRRDGGHRDEGAARATGGAAAHLRRQMPGHPLRRGALRLLARLVRARMRSREALRFMRSRIFGRARWVATELGNRLAALAVLDAPEDVFHLQMDELLGYVEGWSASTDLRSLARVRRAEFQRHALEPTPARRFRTHGIAHVGHGFEADAPGVGAAQGDAIRGAPCSAGVVRAPVRFVRNPRRANLRAGEIIVAERTDPGWVILFPLAAGLLVERGNILSHCAIVAREAGLPMIAALPGLGAWLADGDIVEMDGASGRVTRVRHGTGTGGDAD